MQSMAEASGSATSTIRVRDQLQNAILEGSLEPGERLRAEALAQRFGTSRTPVREALLVLEAEGLVTLEPHKGAVVRAFDGADLLDLYEIRALVEPFAAARAAERITAPAKVRLVEMCDEAAALDPLAPASVDEHIALNEAFHRTILEAAASPRLTTAMRAVAGIPRIVRQVFWRDEAQRAQSLACHRELAAALRAGRPQMAEAVMRMHILGARDFLLEVLRTPGDG